RRRRAQRAGAGVRAENRGTSVRPHCLHVAKRYLDAVMNEARAIDLNPCAASDGSVRWVDARNGGGQVFEPIFRHLLAARAANTSLPVGKAAAALRRGD